VGSFAATNSQWVPSPQGKKKIPACPHFVTPVPEHPTAPSVQSPGRIVAPAGAVRSTLVGAAVTAVTTTEIRKMTARISDTIGCCFGWRTERLLSGRLRVEK